MNETKIEKYLYRFIYNFQIIVVIVVSFYDIKVGWVNYFKLGIR